MVRNIRLLENIEWLDTYVLTFFNCNEIYLKGVLFFILQHYTGSLIFINFYDVKKTIVIIFQEEKGNTFTLLIIFIVKRLQKEQIAQIYCYDPQSAGINLQ